MEYRVWGRNFLHSAMNLTRREFPGSSSTKNSSNGKKIVIPHDYGF